MPTFRTKLRLGSFLLCKLLALGIFHFCFYGMALRLLTLQQLARVICDGKDLTEDEITLLSRIYDIEEIPQIYQSWWADPIKFEIRSNDVEFFENNLGEYIRLWLDLGRKHPDSYLKAWIDQTRGYWNGGYFYHLYNQMVSENPMELSEQSRAMLSP